MTLYLAGRGDVDAAADLIQRHGHGAPAEAAARANRSRNLGNHLHFCRWRQVERLVHLLAAKEAEGTIH